ncbi:MAG: hypothetical protein C7B46_17550 [Sulfobacillus benefaciens]|uniref:Orc1-like AAA ATPase domain-containing protein n=1 Tax=Sulfobacillus benefaciens TaxID=453960 RepID=A0A2T2X8I8_9FIRM|nr:MAG: hypothetical protein C7B46_17550 [Sulfobacillus benefaciens]
MHAKFGEHPQVSDSMPERIFVGRHHEMDILKRWVSTPRPASTVYAVSGIGGVGKSSLLAHFYQYSSTSGIPSLWVDGRSCVRTPQGFLDHLASAWEFAGLPTTRYASLNHALATILQKQKVVVTIDNFDALSAISEWLLHVWLRSLPEQRLMLIMAARTFSIPRGSGQWMAGKRWESLSLELLSSSEVMEFVAHALPTAPRSLHQQLVQLTGGLPLALTLALESTRGKTPRQEMFSDSPIGEDQWIHTLIGQWLREVSDEGVQSAVEALSLVESADQDTLSAALGQAMPMAQYLALTSLSFVRTTTDGVTLHDLVREYLRRDLEQRRPAHIWALRHRLSDYLLNLLHTGTASLRSRAARQLLTLSVDALPLPTGYADLSAHGVFSPQSPFQPDDLPHLERMVKDWAHAYALPGQWGTYLKFLQEFSQRFPDDIRILRDSQGVPLAASFFTIVHRNTGELLSRYFPAETRECLTREEMMRSPQYASTYYAILVCVNQRATHLPVADLTGALIREGLALLGSGTRVTLVATHPDLLALLTSLGFTITPAKSRDCDLPGLKAHVCTLDLTGGRFGQWVRYLLQRSQEPMSPLEPFAVSNEVKRTGLDPTILRRGLSLLPSPSRFYRSELAEKWPGSAEELHLLLIRALNGHDPSLWRYVSEDLLTLLRHSFLSAGSTTMSVAEELHLSRASYYRRLRTALEGMVEWLDTIHPSGSFLKP